MRGRAFSPAAWSEIAITTASGYRLRGVLPILSWACSTTPQTSGGLLMSVAAEKARKLLADLQAGGEEAFILGEVVAGDGRIVARKGS